VRAIETAPFNATELSVDFKSISQFSNTTSFVHPDNANLLKTFSEPSCVIETHEGKVSHTLLGALSKVSPALAARVGYASLAKSRCEEELPWQKKLRQSARIWRTPHVKFYGGEMTMYEWGNGDGPTVLMVNGWGERATYMARMIEYLVQSGFRVVSFDRPPYGDAKESTSDLIEFSTAIHVAAQAAGELHAIVSHSFGAAMAMAAVRDWGDVASRHVLISPIDYRRWISNEFGKHGELCLHVVRRMREVVDERYDRLVNWDLLTMCKLLRSNRRPLLLVRDEHDTSAQFCSVRGKRNAGPNINYFPTARLTRDQQPHDPSVIARVTSFLRFENALTARVRNERLC
jgi:pimeloyl-ACP methyl ester carboxylesterase